MQVNSPIVKVELILNLDLLIISNYLILRKIYHLLSTLYLQGLYIIPQCNWGSHLQPIKSNLKIRCQADLRLIKIMTNLKVETR